MALRRSATALLLLSCGCSSLAPDPIELGGAAASEAASCPEAEPGAAFLIVEGEAYDARDDQRLGKGWVRQPSAQALPAPDPDPPHLADASGGGMVELLPDTRVTEDDPTTNGLWQAPGAGPLLHYYVEFSVPGRHVVWVRGHSGGTEDETLHVALDGDWSLAVTVKLCDSANTWQWSSQLRTDAFECDGVGTALLDVSTPGLHTVSVAGREDGFELDKWLMTTSTLFVPRGTGPAPGACEP